MMPAIAAIEHIPIGDEPVADIDTNLGRCWKSFSHTAVKLGKDGDNENHQDRDHDHRDADDRARIDHRAFDFFLQPVGFFDEQSNPI